MSVTVLEKTALGVSGLTAASIGVAILAAPHSFFASYGITVGNNASLLSELRAPGAGLAAFGVLMLLGIWRTAMTPMSRVVALIVFLAFPAGRLIGLIVDGLPSNHIIAALVFELAVAALCIVAFSRRSAPVQAQVSVSRTEH